MLGSGDELEQPLGGNEALGANESDGRLVGVNKLEGGVAKGVTVAILLKAAKEAERNCRLVMDCWY